MAREDKSRGRQKRGAAAPLPHSAGPGITPYAMPSYLDHELAEILAYWEELKRRENDIPFWDDVHLTALREFSNTLMMIDVFEKPERFRFGVVGRAIVRRYGGDVESHFVDEIARRTPFEYLVSQCSATVQASAPTFYHHIAANAHEPDPSKSYLRMLLPLWGEGHIAMLLGAVVLAE